jgi:hypothetical protein
MVGRGINICDCEADVREEGGEGVCESVRAFDFVGS